MGVVMNLFKNYAAMLKREFEGYNLASLVRDLLAGLTVCAVALPLALAFGVSSGATAAAGLVTAIIAGIVISLLSGASFQISGPTGAMSAVLIPIVMKYGVSGVFAVSFIAGIILLLCALFKLGGLVKIIPAPVITGFTSGIAVIIALGQIDNFFGTASVGDSALAKLASYAKLGFAPDYKCVLLALVVVAVMIAWPKKWNAVVPSSLVGIIVSTVICVAFKLDVPTVGAIPKSLLLADRLDFASFDPKLLLGYLSPAVSIAALGMIESLLCGASASRMTGEKFNPDIELVAQGVGNILIPFFGGVPATAAIARTSVAVKSGCKTRLCGVFHALGLLASMFLLGTVMAKLPLSALAGVLMVTAWRMNEWSAIKAFFKNKMYTAIGEYLITMLATVVFDLTTAIIIGILFSAVCFVVKSARLEAERDGAALKLRGALFFANVPKLERIFSESQSTESLSLSGVGVIDSSGAMLIKEFCAKSAEAGQSLRITDANQTVARLLSAVGVELSDAKNYENV